MKCQTKLVEVPAHGTVLNGELCLPRGAVGLVIFVHGSGSSRYSPRDRHVALAIQKAGLATLLIDSLSEKEELLDLRTAELCFDVDMLADRLVKTTDWLAEQAGTKDLRVGYFGSGTGAAAALVAAANRPERVGAVVSCGGWPDLAVDHISAVRAPTLLIVGEMDHKAIERNESAFIRFNSEAETRLVTIPRATHLFPEPGALEQVAKLSSHWFSEYLLPSLARQCN